MVIGIILMLLVAWWLSLSKQVLPPTPLSQSATISTNTSSLGNTPNQSSTSKVAPPSTAPSLPKSNWIDSKMAEMLAVWNSANGKSLDFYGKVVDQYGQPVTGAKVQGNVMSIHSMTQSNDKIYLTETDGSGLFKFIGLHGVELGIWPQKEGYVYNLKLPSRRPDNYQPSPDNVVTFTMWKLKGSEPMIHARIHAYIPCNGAQTSFNILTGKSGGNLIVTLNRNPVNIDRSKPFDWTITISLATGGLVKITDLYPNEAPINGYQPSLTINMPANDKNWSHSINGSYYFQSGNGQIYGRMIIKITANFQPPPTFFGADIYANPSGSRNLEFDPAKQINQ